MNSKERVMTAFAHEEPDKVPRWCGATPEFWAKAKRELNLDDEGVRVRFGDDFGSQTGPLLSPEMFNSFLLPTLKRFIDLGHDYNLLVQLHCCGGFAPLIPSMIEAGLDGLHALQPSCFGMDPSVLKAAYGERILLNGAIDSHHVLIDCPTPQCVREKTVEVLDIMAPGGGYVAGASHDTILDETPLENVLAMFDAIEEYRG